MIFKLSGKEGEFFFTHIQVCNKYVCVCVFVLLGFRQSGSGIVQSRGSISKSSFQVLPLVWLLLRKNLSLRRTSITLLQNSDASHSVSRGLNITNTALWWVDHAGHSKQCIWLKTRVRRSSVRALLWDDADEPSPVVCRTCGLEAKMESCLIHQPRWSVCRCELGMSNRYIETFTWNWNIWILICNSIHQTGRRTRSSTLTISCSSNTEHLLPSDSV